MSAPLSMTPEHEVRHELRNKAAEILYISGYAVTCEFFDSHAVIVHNGKQCNVNPFESGLEAKRQACVIIEWLMLYKNKLWKQSSIEPGRPGQTSWQHVLNRLAWCMHALGK